MRGETVITRAFVVKCDRERIFQREVTEVDNKISWEQRVSYKVINNNT